MDMQRTESRERREGLFRLASEFICEKSHGQAHQHVRSRTPATATEGGQTQHLTMAPTLEK